MSLHAIAAPAALALLATANVGLWTLRVALATRGRRSLAAMVSSLEAVLYVLAFSRVVDALDDPVRVGAYAVGVGAGTLLGLVTEERLRPPSPAGDPCTMDVVVTRPARRRRRPVRARPARQAASARPPRAARWRSRPRAAR